MNTWMMKQITENLNVSPEENDIIDELKSIIGGWGEISEKQDILGLIKNYTNNKSLYEDVRTTGPINWDKYRESGYKGGGVDWREEVVFTDKTFYSIVELLVNEKELADWDVMNGEYSENDFEYIRLKAINPISKLFGKTLSVLPGNLDSMLNKLYWAVIDNYEDIKSGEIDEFKYLTLRKIISYKLDLLEAMSERRTYIWTVTVLGYDKEDVYTTVIENEDGQYDPWKYNYETDDDEIDDRTGIEINGVQKEIIKESTNTEDIIGLSGEPMEKAIDELDVIIMERIVKDYSVTEIEQLVQYYWQELHELDNILKLFGKRGQLKLAKQYIQFIWDNNIPKEFTQYLGQKLPTLKRFTFKVRWTDNIIESRIGNIVVYDTRYDVAACDVTNNVLDYDISEEEIENQEFNQAGYGTEREIVSSKIGNKTVYDISTPDKWDNKYNFYELC